MLSDDVFYAIYNVTQDKWFINIEGSYVWSDVYKNIVEFTFGCLYSKYVMDATKTQLWEITKYGDRLIFVACELNGPNFNDVINFNWSSHDE